MANANALFAQQNRAEMVFTIKKLSLQSDQRAARFRQSCFCSRATIFK